VSSDLATARATIAELKSTTQRLSRLVQQLLALGRIGPDGSHSMEFVRTDLVPLVQDIGSGFAEQAARRDIALELDLPAAPVVARVHPDLVSEALSNLLDNAIRYTPVGGAVTLSIGYEMGGGVLRVEDNGPGIAPEHRERVFERFYRILGSGQKGSGLGLALVRAIAERHNGKVGLRSRLGRGTVFILRLPTG